jgi:hypothetical protein
MIDHGYTDKALQFKSFIIFRNKDTIFKFNSKTFKST